MVEEPADFIITPALAVLVILAGRMDSSLLCRCPGGWVLQASSGVPFHLTMVESAISVFVHCTRPSSTEHQIDATGVYGL